jgi:uncharacterized protein (TIGR02145 family)
LWVLAGLAAILCAIGGLVFAQTAGKPKIALYIANDKLPVAEQEVLTNKFLDPFTASGLYSVIDRSNVFLNQKTQEMLKQMSGDVRDKEIARIGQEAGAKYVCIINLVEAFGQYNISARLVDVETAEIYKATGQTDLKNLTGGEVDRAAREIFSKIHGGTVMAPAGGTSADSKSYRAVKIGNQMWMAENLNRATANSWCYDNSESNCNKYGRLYTWDAAKGACPAGWHLPTRIEWNALVTAVGGASSAGGKLKSKSPNWNGTDDYGFSALSGGSRYPDGSVSGVGSFGYWWTATPYGASKANSWYMRTGNADVREYDYGKDYGFSVRCVQD